MYCTAAKKHTFLPLQFRPRIDFFLTATNFQATAFVEKNNVEIVVDVVSLFFSNCDAF